MFLWLGSSLKYHCCFFTLQSGSIQSSTWTFTRRREPNEPPLGRSPVTHLLLCFVLNVAVQGPGMFCDQRCWSSSSSSSPPCTLHISVKSTYTCTQGQCPNALQS